ncbi:hypothetical protein LCGC14_0978890 [marine sediment metagenome]|uniref:Uncharacterized protein n=1 Tax=marine sediment metagenome TaxID=412755 RepID=A0A0F9NVM7_9ZZZZ
MEINRLIAKQADLLRFNKSHKKTKSRKEPQNFIIDYMLAGILFLAIILLVLFLIAGAFVL